MKKPLDAKGADAVADVANGWWDFGATLTGSRKTVVQAHAADLYRAIVDTLPGRSRPEIEKRIESTRALNFQRFVDLLESTAPATDAISGSWSMEDGLLVCEQADGARIEFRYSPPGEYDFLISFTFVEGSESIMQLSSRDGHPFAYGMGVSFGKLCAVADGEVATRDKPWVSNGRRYTSVMKVRRSGIQTFLDGQQVCNWQGNYSDAKLVPNAVWKLPHDDRIGVGAWSDRIRFDRIEVRELSGRGKLIGE